jgi:outer membrane lipoprotein-sorting protein
VKDFRMFPRTLALALFAVSALAVAQQPDARLQATLAKLDAASKHFTSAQADFKKELYTAAVHDTETQNGKAYFVREQGATQFGILLLKPDGKTERIAKYENGTIRDFNAKDSCVDTLHAAPNKIETFLTLGFGGSGKDLAKSWQITDLGPEKIDGVVTEKLDLVPLAPDVKSNVKRVTLWVDLDRDVSLQQIFYLPTRDTQTAHYFNIQLNKKIDAKPFEFKGKSCGK